MPRIPIPPDYSSASEASNRASGTWGIRDGVGHLKGLLISGKLKAWEVDQTGVPSERPSEMRKDPKNDSLLYDPSDYGPIRDERLRNIRILFRTSDLKQHVPGYLNEHGFKRALTSVPESGVTGSRIGRPPKFGADDFWIEAFRTVIAQEQGFRGQTQQQFVDAMMKWISQSQKKSRGYTRSTVEAKIEKLWRHVGLGK